VFGTPSDAVLEQLHQKAAMLGSHARVTVHVLASGFERLSALRH